MTTPRSMAASAGLLSLCLFTAAYGQYPGMPPGGMPPGGMPPGGMPQGGMPPGAMGAAPEIPQTELTETSAKGAIDAYLLMAEKYGKDVPEPSSTAQGFSDLAEVEEIVNAEGFSNTGEWHTALVSVAMAYGFAKDGNEDEIDASIAKIKDNPQIPANLKQQMLATITSIRPSDNNLSVVKSLMADSEYKEKLDGLGN